jgi:hypothetical protein
MTSLLSAFASVLPLQFSLSLSKLSVLSRGNCARKLDVLLIMHRVSMQEFFGKKTFSSSKVDSLSTAIQIYQIHASVVSS